MTRTSSPLTTSVNVIAPARTTLPLKGVVAVVIGNWLEFYDFLVFTFFAVMIGEALGVTIFGGTTQFVVAWLIDWTKDPMVPAWYQIIANIVSIIGVLLLVPQRGGARPSNASACPRVIFVCGGRS